MAEEQDEPKKRRRQDKMGDAEKQQLRDLMRRPDVRNEDGTYNLPIIVKLSGLTYQQVYGFVTRDTYQHAQIGEVNANKLTPTDPDLIDRAPPQVPESLVNFTAQQYDEYQAMLRQQRKMHAKDWEALGMSPDDGVRMEHYGKLGKAPMGGVLAVMSGQLMSNMAILDRIIKGDAERILGLNGHSIPIETDKKGEERDPGEVERDWRYMVYAGMQLQLNMTAHAHKIQAIMARVMKDLREMNGGAKPHGKGDFKSRD